MHQCRGLTVDGPLPVIPEGHAHCAVEIAVSFAAARTMLGDERVHRTDVLPIVRLATRELFAMYVSGRGMVYL